MSRIVQLLRPASACSAGDAAWQRLELEEK